MDFEFTEEQQALQSMVRRFADRELASLVDEVEASGLPPSREWLHRYAELGILGINAPEEFGGLGLPALDALIVIEEMARVSVGVAFPVFECCTGPVRIVERFGTPELRQRVVPKVIAGDMIVAVSMSEPDAGSALTDLTTRARIEGGKIIISGTKRWCSGAGHSEGYVVFCRMSDAPGAAGIGAVFVDKDTPGFTFGKQEQLMGFRGVPSADMFFDSIEVPLENLLVEAGGFSKLMGVFNLERAGNTAMSIGVAEGAFQQALAYVQERKQFGKAIIDFQATQIRLAEMRIKIDACRLMLHRAASRATDGLPPNMETSLAKCMANEAVRDVTGSALQLMGGYGYAEQFGMARRMRDAWGWGIAGGTIDIQKVNIASALVGRRFNQHK